MPVITMTHCEKCGGKLSDDAAHYCPSSASPTCSTAPTRDEFAAAAVETLGWTKEQAGEVYDAMKSLTFADFDRMAERLGL